MTIRVAIQMDPIESINIKKDTTFLLALEAQKRGFELYYYQPKNLSFYHGQVLAFSWPVTLRPVVGDHFTLGNGIILDLADTDVILMRQDPPFNMEYITLTHILEMIADKTKIINNPASVRNAPEKLSPLLFPELIPTTLISQDPQQILHFLAEHKDIILKPIYVFGGADVFRLRNGDANISSTIEILLSKYHLPLVAQTYIPEVVEGDKRVILINGEPIGAIKRVPQSGEVRANMHAGGTPTATTLTKRDLEICTRLKDTLVSQGLYLTGIDIIGDYLTEINVTSPTGCHEINHFDNISCEAIFWDKLFSC